MTQIKSFITTCFVAAMAGGLVACAGFAPDGTTGLTRAVKLIGPEPTLLVQVQDTLEAVPAVDVVPEDSFADLTIIIREGGQTSEGLFTTKPPIVGILRQQQEPSYIRLSYTVLSQEGQTLAEGEVVGLGQDKTGYFPSLKPQQSASQRQQALHDALKQLREDVARDVRQAPFSAKVSTQLAGSGQVAIPVYMHAGLTPKHTFRVEGQPESKLRFVGLTKGFGNGQSATQTHALLEVIKGPLPELGTRVVLEAGRS